MKQARRPGFFRLDPVDQVPRNDRDEATGRTNFRLHHPGRTIGCIAAVEQSDWDRVDSLIRSTSTLFVYDEGRPFWKFLAKPELLEKYGTLIVR